MTEPGGPKRPRRGPSSTGKPAGRKPRGADKGGARKTTGKRPYPQGAGKRTPRPVADKRSSRDGPEKRTGRKSTDKRTTRRSTDERAPRQGADKRSYRESGDERGPRPRAAKRTYRDSGDERGRGQGAGRKGSGGPRTGRQDAARNSAEKRKRTSRNSDDRNPTKSGVQYPSPKYRPVGGDAEPVAKAERSSLRKVDRTRGRPSDQPARERKSRRGPTAAPRRRRPVKTTEATEELGRLARRNARGAQQQLARAADTFAAGREREAARLLRPLRDAYPDASAVRELLGLCNYRMAHYAAAARELDAFVELTDSVEQHPVLMDCNRALGKYRRVDELWEELAVASPSNALVIEGRIVLAGARADRGKVRDAIALLEKRAADVKRVQEHHLRLWYALADLYERAGEVARARDLFARVRRYDPSFADVAERAAALA